MQHAMLVQTTPTTVIVHLLHVQYHPFLMGIKLASSRGKSQGCYPHLNQAWVLPYHQDCPQPDGNMLLHSHQAPKSSDANHAAPPFVILLLAWLEKLHSLLPTFPFLNTLCVQKSCLHKMRAGLRDMLNNHNT